MGFNKNKGLSAVITIIILAVVNIVAFLMPILHTFTFWLGYGFATLATVLMLAVVFFLFDSDNSYKSFLRLSLTKIAWIYYVIQIAVSMCQILDVAMPYLSALIINCCITGLFLIFVLSSHVAVESIEKQEEEIQQKVLFLQNIQVMLNSISTTDVELSVKIKNLIDDFKYSDPMSHSMLSEMEKQIESKVIMLKADIADIDKASNEISQIGSMLQERNMKCKMLKNVKDENKERDNSGVKYVNTAIGVLGVIATIIMTVCFFVIPNNKYNYAMTLYETEKYAEAIAAFESVKGFRKSEEMISLSQDAIYETVYQEATELFVNESYAESIAVFKEIEEYKDSKEMIEQAQENIYETKYQVAKALLDSEKYEEAIVAFKEIENYEDSKEMIDLAEGKIKDAKYIVAEKYFAEQNYVEAIKEYTALGDYKDSKQKIEQIHNRLSEDDGIIYYGSYQDKPIAWQTIEVEEDKLLLIANECITELPFNNELKNVEWSESTLCDWLNNEFIIAFSSEQLESIITTNVDGLDSKVFLLSDDEADDIEDNSIFECEKSWWLRTKSDNNALFIEPSGRTNYEGENVIRAKGVRPCIWISLE